MDEVTNTIVHDESILTPDELKAVKRGLSIFKDLTSEKDAEEVEKRLEIIENELKKIKDAIGVYSKLLDRSHKNIPEKSVEQLVKTKNRIIKELDSEISKLTVELTFIVRTLTAIKK